MGFYPSASKLDLAMSCRWPWTPAATPWGKERFTSAAADKGNAAHDAAESHVDGGAKSGASDHGYRRARGVRDVARVAVDEWTDGAMVVEERPIAYDPSTGVGRLLAKPSNKRDYSMVRPGEFIGTADLVVARPGELMVLDHKTGRRARLKSAADSWQLRMLALGVASACGADRVTVGFLHLDDDDYRPDVVTFEAWDLDTFRSDLLRLREQLDARDATPIPGRHCHDLFCPVRAKCPATLVAMSRLEDDMKRRLPVIGPIESEEQARSWLVGIKLVEERLNEIKATVNDFASRQRIYLGDGMWYGSHEKSGRDVIDLSVPGALKAVVKTAGRGVVEYRVTKSAIEDATRARQEKRGEGKRRAEALYEHLRRGGALKKTGNYHVVGEYKAAPPEEECEALNG